jgi:GTP-binding protein Era
MKSGFVAVAGRPNVGKSTLVNALTGTKVAIVSDKPHTTRHQIRGVYTTDEAQLVLVDLPGWQKPIDTLTERMQGRVDETIAGDVDVVLVVVSARERIGAGDRFVARRVFSLEVPVIIVVNKIDRLKAGHIASQMKEAATLGEFHALHPVSAVTGDGIDELRSDLISLLPEGPMYYPAETDTDMSDEARIAELVREQALKLLKEELPHAITAEVVEVEGKHVHVRLYTETESQKQILIGKGGSMVREIAGEGLAEVAAQRDDARAAGPLMALLRRIGDEIVVTLNDLEKTGALRGDVHVPFSAVRSVRVSTSPFVDLQGMRAPGTGIPGVIALGTWRSKGAKDFVAVYRGGPAVVVELEGAEFRRLVVSAHDAVAVAELLRS